MKLFYQLYCFEESSSSTTSKGWIKYNTCIEMVNYQYNHDCVCHHQTYDWPLRYMGNKHEHLLLKQNLYGCQLSDYPPDDVIAKATHDALSDGDSETDSEESVHEEIQTKSPKSLEDLTSFKQDAKQENINHLLTE